MGNTTVILKKITTGSRHLRGDREIEYTLLQEEHYSYERLFEDKNLDRFFIEEGNIQGYILQEEALIIC